MRLIFIIEILFLVYSRTSYGLTVSFTGYGWDLWSPTAQNQDEWRVNNVSLPGDVYLNLYETGKIDDPYYRDNDVKLRWISYENWSYQRSIDLSSEIFNKKAIVLAANGLDTVSNIYVNDVLVGNSSNMFRTYFYDIRSIIKQGHSNTLRLDFFSPVNYSKNQALDHKAQYGYSVPFDCPGQIQHGECHANFIRKDQSQFSWDWGPAFPTMGLDGDLTLEAFDMCFLKTFSALPFYDDISNNWNLHAEFWLYCVDKSVGDVTFRVSNQELKLNYSWTDHVGGQGLNRFYQKIPIPKSTTVHVWWPNGFGDQILYDITGQFSSGTEIGSETLHVGFRRVELIQDPLPNVKDGATFYFKINDIPIFLKGSNWIPGDSFLRRVTEDRLRFYFESMRQANMNCIRVWGGGVFESDYFYELADQYGISLWHDMMFAVDLYPATNEFLDNVKGEVDDQINRLKHHASIIIWAGNNENEAGLAWGWFPLDAPYETYKKDYLELYNETIYGVINDTDFQTRPYVLSSPSNGIDTWMEGGLSKNPGDTLYGDVHFYNYDSDAWDWKTFPIPRCVTEFGYQSFASVETFRTGLKNIDLHFISPQMLHRQHHPLGEFQMFAQINRQFKIFGAGGVVPKFENMVYLTQIHQAMAYKTEVEHYRRWRSYLNDKGEGLTMCSLYWQLNDIWQAPTWASIDYGLKWKPAHYMARNFYYPVLVSPYIDGENLKVTVVNDLNEDFKNLVVVIDTYLWKTSVLIYQVNVSIPILNRLSSMVIFEANLDRLRAPLNDEDLYDLFNTRIIDSNGQQVGPNNVLFPDKFRIIPSDYYGKVAITDVWTENSTFAIKIKANKISPFVWLDVEGVRGWFSDNAFTMLVQETTVKFTAWDDVSLEVFKSKLTVKTLGDLYKSGSLGLDRRMMEKILLEEREKSYALRSIRNGPIKFMKG